MGLTTKLPIPIDSAIFNDYYEALAMLATSYSKSASYMTTNYLSSYHSLYHYIIMHYPIMHRSAQSSLDTSRAARRSGLSPGSHDLLISCFLPRTAMTYTTTVHCTHVWLHSCIAVRSKHRRLVPAPTDRLL